MFEYELDVNFEVITATHLAQASKDRTQLFANRPEFIISEKTGEELLNWSKGTDDEMDFAMGKIRGAKSIEDLMAVYKSYPEYHKVPDFMACLSAQKAEINSLAQTNV